MTADIMLAQIEKLENSEKNRFLDEIYDKYFNKGVSTVRLLEEARILEAYYNGELVEAEA